MAALTRKFPFDGTDVTEAEWREMAQHWRSDGILPGVGSGMAVTVSSGLVLSVAAGAAIVRGHYGVLDTSTTVSVGAGHATNPRIDLVVLRLDTVANDLTVEVVAGTAAATPVAPALTQTSATWEIELARVSVAALAASVTNDNITDRRTVFEAGQQTQPNPVRNASFAIWQRGTSAAVGAGSSFVADGWKAFRSGFAAGMTVSRQLAADITGSAYCARMQRDSGNSSTAALYMQQSIPTADCLRFQGRQATISWRARKGATYSAASNVFHMQGYTGTGTDESLSAGFTGSSTLFSTACTVTNNWQTFSVTVTVPTTATEIGLQPVWTPVGTAGATDSVDVKDVRIDEGPVPLPHIPLPYAQDLAENQRFFWRCGGVSTSDNIALAQVNAATTAVAWIRHPVQMRANASLTVSGPTTFTVNDVATAPATTGVALDGGTAHTVHGASVVFTVAGGLTTGRAARVYANAGYLDFSAEI